MSNYYAASAFFNGLCGIFLVYYIYLRNKKNPLNRSFLYFGISVAGWSLIYALWGWSKDAHAAEFYLRRHMMFCAFIPATFLHFVMHFTRRYECYKKWLILSYCLGVLYSLGMLSNALIAGVRPIMFFEFWPKPGPLLFTNVVYFFTMIISAFALLFQHFFRTSGIERKQTALIIVACLIGFGGGSINWFLWFDIMIPPTTNFFVGFMFVITAYAIVRYGLMDVDAIVEILRSSRSATVGLVASSMNHELRNPLFIAKGKMESHLDAVEQGIFTSPADEAEKGRAVVQNALHQLTRAMDIMKKFSDFSKPNASETQKEQVPVGEVFKDVLTLASKEFEMKKIRINPSSPNDNEKDTINMSSPNDFVGDQQATSRVNGLSVTANRRQLEEIFFNLIVNACQAMGESGGDLHLKAYQPNGKVLVEISDTGPGIPKEIERRLFEPFHTTKAEKGSGLGLYITKQLVERNGGKISVKSKAGTGTKFMMEFQPASCLAVH